MVERQEKDTAFKKKKKRGRKRILRKGKIWKNKIEKKKRGRDRVKKMRK